MGIKGDIISTIPIGPLPHVSVPLPPPPVLTHDGSRIMPGEKQKKYQDGDFRFAAVGFHR